MASAVEVDGKFNLDSSLVARYTVVPAFSGTVFSLTPARFLLPWRQLLSLRGPFASSHLALRTVRLRMGRKWAVVQRDDVDV